MQGDSTPEQLSTPKRTCRHRMLLLDATPNCGPVEMTPCRCAVCRRRRPETIRQRLPRRRRRGGMQRLCWRRGSCRRRACLPHGPKHWAAPATRCLWPQTIMCATVCRAPPHFAVTWKRSATRQLCAGAPCLVFFARLVLHACSECRLTLQEERMREHLSAAVQSGNERAAAGGRRSNRRAAGVCRCDFAAAEPASAAAEIAAACCGLGALTQRPLLAARGLHTQPWRPHLWADLAAASA